MITIDNVTPQQKVILDALWTADSPDTITALMLVFGKAEVQAMQNMLIAAAFDSITDTTEANDYLRKFQA
jgi:hypothetical protein